MTRILPSSIHHRLAIVGAIVSLMGFATLMPLPFPATAPQVRSVDIDARLFAYEPSVVHVNRGDTVTIHLQSLDAEHGLFIDGYSVNINAEPGRSSEATFVANKTGSFRMRCSVACGALHPFMIGELQVQPNLPFMRAVLLTLIAALGGLIFFWKA